MAAKKRRLDVQRSIRGSRTVLRCVAQIGLGGGRIFEAIGRERGTDVSRNSREILSWVVLL